MKKYLALLLAVLMLLSVTACGKDAGGDDAATTTTTTTTAPDATGDSTTTTGDETTTTAEGTTTTTAAPTTTTTTNTYVPGGATVPIGTKPTTTTTTKAPTTTTTAQPEDPTGGGTTTTTTTATTTTTTTTTVTTKPTEVTGPYIILPEIGSDIDVTKKKNRIRVSDVAAWNEADGSIGVALTFKNYSSNWITEETNYVMYTCYDKNGKVVQKATKLNIGVIDTKKNSVRTYEFKVPANTYEVKITKSNIVYWTEWA